MHSFIFDSFFVYNIYLKTELGQRTQTSKQKLFNKEEQNILFLKGKERFVSFFLIFIIWLFEFCWSNSADNCESLQKNHPVECQCELGHAKICKILTLEEEFLSPHIIRLKTFKWGKIYLFVEPLTMSVSFLLQQNRQNSESWNIYRPHTYRTFET